MSRPFEGVRVVEVAAWTFVPGAGAIMADLGADVIKVEPPTGDPQRALTLLERALEIAQEQDRELEFLAFNALGTVHRDTGRPQQALRMFQKAFSITQQVENQAIETIILNNIGMTYQAIGQPQQALATYCDSRLDYVGAARDCSRLRLQLFTPKRSKRCAAAAGGLHRLSGHAHDRSKSGCRARVDVRPGSGAYHSWPGRLIGPGRMRACCPRLRMGATWLRLSR